MKLLFICALSLLVADQALARWRAPRECGVIFRAQTDDDCTLGSEIMPVANHASFFTFGWTFDQSTGKCAKVGVCRYNFGTGKNVFASAGACRSYCLPDRELHN